MNRPRSIVNALKRISGAGPEDRHRSAAARRLYSTREAAEACLYREERDRLGLLLRGPTGDSRWGLRQMRAPFSGRHAE